jgi:uncharacterized protein YkwD
VTTIFRAANVGTGAPSSSELQRDRGASRTRNLAVSAPSGAAVAAARSPTAFAGCRCPIEVPPDASSIGDVTTHCRTSLAALSAAALALAAGSLADPAAASTCVGADTAPTVVRLPQARQATLCLINAQRRVHGLRALHADMDLRDAARGYASTMVRHAFFSHVSPGGSTLLHRVRRTAYPLSDQAAWLIGENLAWGAGPSATPRAIVAAWMRSPDHRRNVLRTRFAHIGIGIALGAPVRRPVGPTAATYVTDFGSI